MRRLLLITGILSVAMPLQAFAFTPKQCSQQTWTAINWTFTANGSVRWDQWEIQHNPVFVSQYANQISYTRRLLANRYVDEFGFNLSAFHTENYDDMLIWGEYGYVDDYLSGDYATPPGWRNFDVSQSLEETPAYVRFYSDEVTTDDGFVISQAHVRCRGTPTDEVAELYPGERVDGFLLGDDDVVYFKFEADSTNSFAAVIWGPGDQTKDVDLYLRCNALPSNSEYFAVSWSSDNEEAIYLPPSLCPNGTWFGAVHAYDINDTPTWFGLMLSKHRPEANLNLKAGISFVPTPSQLTRIEASLRKGAKQFFGATEGIVYISEFDLYRGVTCYDTIHQSQPCSQEFNHCHCGGSDCDICIHKTIPGSGLCRALRGSPNAMQTVVISGGEWTSDQDCLAHEMGHAYFGLIDEYETGKPGECSVPGQTTEQCCGHSLMGLTEVSKSNFCYHYDSLYHDHEIDAANGAGGTGTGAAWDEIETLGIEPTGFLIEATPDNFRFTDFPCVVATGDCEVDFGGLIGLIDRHW